MDEYYSIVFVYHKQMTWITVQKLKRLPAMQETQELWVWSHNLLGQEDPLEEEIATHSSILAWKIPWTDKPGGLQSTGLQRFGRDWATEHALNAS